MTRRKKHFNAPSKSPLTKSTNWRPPGIEVKKVKLDQVMRSEKPCRKPDCDAKVVDSRPEIKVDFDDIKFDTGFFGNSSWREPTCWEESSDMEDNCDQRVRGSKPAGGGGCCHAKEDDAVGDRSGAKMSSTTEIRDPTKVKLQRRRRGTICSITLRPIHVLAYLVLLIISLTSGTLALEPTTSKSTTETTTLSTSTTTRLTSTTPFIGMTEADLSTTQSSGAVVIVKKKKVQAEENDLSPSPSDLSHSGVISSSGKKFS